MRGSEFRYRSKSINGITLGIMKHLKLFLCLAVITVFSSCELYSSQTGGGTEAEGLTGTLVDPQGLPVTGALVQAFSGDTAIKNVLAKTTQFANSAMDSDVTDTAGHFRLHHLKQGDYNLMGSIFRNGSTLNVCHQAIHFRGFTNLGRDTLRIPGAILIRAVSEGLPVKGVQCALLENSLFTISDSSGTCNITGVPQGIFHVQMQDNDFYPDTSTAINVLSGKTTDAGTLTLISNAITLYNSRDNSIGPGGAGYNLGLNNDISMMESTSVALIAFDGIKSALAGKTIKKAEVILHGWTDASPNLNYKLYVYSAPNDWTEGTGNWFYFDGAKQNTYDAEYQMYPQYTPLSNTTNPAVVSGINWNNSATFRAALQLRDSAQGVVPQSGPGYIPLLQNTAEIFVDVTKMLSGAAVSDTLSLALKQAVFKGNLWMYSKDFLSPQTYGPKLVLHYQ